MGAWIETMPPTTRPELKNGVAPCMGAWIETSQRTPWKKRGARSHPVWVRGLKHNKVISLKLIISRTLYGCVD